jgi:putative FmdB family regulatory protein
VPKYNYGCEACSREWAQWSSVNEPSVECPHCFNKKIKKLPSSFFIMKKNEVKEEKTAKQNVIEHIEDNRKIVKQMKDKAKNKEYKKDV